MAGGCVDVIDNLTVYLESRNTMIHFAVSLKKKAIVVGNPNYSFTAPLDPAYDDWREMGWGMEWEFYGDPFFGGLWITDEYLKDDWYYVPDDDYTRESPHVQTNVAYCRFVLSQYPTMQALALGLSPSMDCDGNIYYFNPWGLHRDNGPAYIGKDGLEYWCQYGK